ncbi:MAG TPA: bifunctional response regulator/alkaline phosphatase family protein [Crocinitomicaceae bacterium]|nr:bifunctional response regulator/alkaline phosphatase family protein [Crocinitomicaceae bacterium]
MQAKILWVDDEIDLLKPHIMFLETKGYSVTTANNGSDAIDICNSDFFNIVFLDENMPGISGLEALATIKENHPQLPVVMITKSEEESIMEDAIGSKIADYLIKPVNPNQILLSLKKNLDQSKLVSQKTNFSYQQEFRQLGMLLNGRLDLEEWADVYKKLVYWELELNKIEDQGMSSILSMQKKEANTVFSKYVERNYLDWINGDSEGVTMLHTLIKDKVAPLMNDEKVFFLVIDNLRYDQWIMIKPMISKYFNVEKEEVVMSILPTATHYARNALFAGLLPTEIQKKFPKMWLNENDEGGKNMYEKEFLEANLQRLGKKNKWSYTKITNNEAGKKLVDNFNQLLTNDFNAVVYNFVDMMSHARTEVEMIRELASDESAYRSITESWFEHSPINDFCRKVAESKAKLIITTDHGTVRVTNPVKIIGEKATNTNLRYKVGRNLSYREKDVFAISRPEDAYLPKSAVSDEFVFCRENDFFVYPNKYNHFVNYYGNTFQHGGISLEELFIPFVVLQPK